jgi:hypothetical protein
MSKSKFLRVKEETYEKLLKLGTWGDTADTLIARLLTESEKSDSLLLKEQPTTK